MVSYYRCAVNNFIQLTQGHKITLVFEMYQVGGGGVGMMTF